MKNYSYVHFNNLLQQIATKDIDFACVTDRECHLLLKRLIKLFVDLHRS